MSTIELVDVADLMDGWSVQFVGPQTGETAGASLVPEQWQPLLTAADPPARCAAATALWNPGWTELVPQFWAMFTERLVDVRVAVAVADRRAMLVYVGSADNGAHVTWVGWDLQTDGEHPSMWEALPEPVQTFLNTVHAGFTASWGQAFGLVPPEFMQTIAELANRPEGIPGWDDEGGISSTRLLRVATDGGLMDYCVSPDLPTEHVALVYEGDVDPHEFGPAIDPLMLYYFGA